MTALSFRCKSLRPSAQSRMTKEIIFPQVKRSSQEITTETQATTTESPTETSHLITEPTTDTTETIFKITCHSETI